jgi:antitoxin HicB
MDRPNYRIELEPLPDDEGGGFVARVPDLPGCMSDGTTDIEALENAHAAIHAWLKRAMDMGRPIPAPSYQRRYA